MYDNDGGGGDDDYDDDDDNNNNIWQNFTFPTRISIKLTLKEAGHFYSHTYAMLLKYRPT